MRRAMGRFVARLIVTLAIVSAGISLLVELLPGDPAVAILGRTGTPEQYAEVRKELALNDSFVERYFSWIGHAVTGDLGNTLLPPKYSVADVIAARLPVTLELALLATLVAVAIAVPVGTWSAYRSGRSFDRAATAVGFALLATPSFLLAFVLILLGVFHVAYLRVGLAAAGVCCCLYILLNGGVQEPITRRFHGRRGGLALGVAALGIAAALLVPEFPRQGYVRIADGGLVENLRSVTLPVLTLALPLAAVFTRLLRTDMIEVLKQDYILVARAKGMPVRHILLKEALRPALVSMLTVAGVELGFLFGGTVVVENIFGLPGLGTQIITSISQKDFLAIQGLVLVMATLFVLVTAFVDVAYSVLDPRIRRAT